MAWRVAWPLAVQLAGMLIVAYAWRQWRFCVPEDSFLQGIVDLASSLAILSGFLLTGWVVAARYRRFVAGPISRIIRICLVFLAVLGVILLCCGIVGLVLCISGYLIWER